MSELDVIRAQAFDELVSELDLAVAERAELGKVRLRLLQPLHMLGALSQETPGVLRGERDAIERMRVLVAASAAHAMPVARVHTLLSEPEAQGRRATRARGKGADAKQFVCDSRLIDLGALVLIGLACGRSGKELGVAPDLFVDTAFGLAFAAGPAEALVRTQGTNGNRSSLASAFLASCFRGRWNRARSPLIALFLADPLERARWRCLHHLFRMVVDQTAQTLWDPTTSMGISGVKSLPPPDEAIEIGIDLAIGARDVVAPEVELEAMLAALKSGHGHVVFASPEAAFEVEPIKVDLGAGFVRAPIPPRVPAGWVGFVDLRKQAQSKRDRDKLRKDWEEANAEIPSLAAAPVRIELIATPTEPAVPARTPFNRFAGGAPSIAASARPQVVEPGATLTLEWSVEGVSGENPVHIEPGLGDHPASGRLKLTAPSDRAEARFTLSAGGAERVVSALVRARFVTVTTAADGRLRATFRPADAAVEARISVDGTWHAMQVSAGRAELVLSSRSVERARVQLRSKDGQLVFDEREVALADVPRATSASVLVVRPAFFQPTRKTATPDATEILTLQPEEVAIARVDRATTIEAFGAAGRVLEGELDVIEPPWIDDASLAVDGIAESAESPAVDALLERLEVLAGRNPGWERAAWVALVPSIAGNEFQRSVPGSAARLLAVATPGAIADLLQTNGDSSGDAPPDSQPPILLRRTGLALPEGEERLRCIGCIDVDGHIKLEPLRVERRSAGPGAPQNTEWTVIGTDETGRELVRRPLRRVTSAEAGSFVVLLPFSAPLAAIEFRRDEGASRDEWFRARERSHERSRDGTRDRARHDSDARFDRPTSVGRIEQVELTGDVERPTLTWQYTHSGGGRGSFDVEVESEGRWSAIARVQGCSHEIVLAVQRLRRRLGQLPVRVTALDEWQGGSGVEAERALVANGAVVLRRAFDRWLWADVDDEFPSITWRAGTEEHLAPDGVTRGGMPSFVAVASSFEGQVEVRVTEGEFATASDAIELEKEAGKRAYSTR